MDGPLLPMGFRDLSAVARGWVIVAALACALFCPPLVLVFFFALTLTVAAAAGMLRPVPVVAKPRPPCICRPTPRGPPAR